jgi:hypothetical protein
MAGIVYRIMPENVTHLWPQLEELFAPALAMTSTHTADDVRRGLLSMRAQLWAQMDGTQVEAACTTEFVDYPSGLYIRVWHAGARRDRRMDDDAFFRVLNDWRIANRCAGFEAVGRHGWLRKFPKARVEGLIMRYTPEMVQ